MTIDYKKKYEECKDELNMNDMRISELSAFRWLFCVSVIFIFSLLIGFSDNVDIDDALGPYLCEQHGKHFVDAKYKLGDSHGLEYLQIRCENTVNIDDGYLVGIK